MNRRAVGAIAAAFGLTIPWLGVWIARTVLPWLSDLLGVAYTVPSVITTASTLSIVAISGIAVLGASFLLAWGAETAEKDVPRAFAIAVLAVLAVAPEYAVDALYAWNAGAFAGTERGVEAGNLAVANMTGANRILIGIGWAGIALFTVLRAGADTDAAVSQRPGTLRNVVTIDRDIGLDIVFLLAATAWAFLVPLGGGIDILDMFVLVGIYVTYIAVILKGDIETHEEHVGVPRYLQAFPFRARVSTVLLLFGYAGLMIFTAVEPFAHGLEAIGTDIGVPSFFMIQWIAPLASESPELIVVVYLVNKARSTAGFNALISSKLNQWTLLIGTLVVVHSIALGEYGALMFDQKQAAEIWITAAQSLFAIGILLNFEISIREALGLLILFLSQVVLEFLMLRSVIEIGITSTELLLVYTGIYVVLSAWLFVGRRRAVVRLFRQVRGTVLSAFGRGPADTPEPGDD